MNKRHLFRNISLFTAMVLLIFSSCNNGDSNGNDETAQNTENTVVSKRAGVNEVIVIQAADCDGMNPFTSTSANASYVQGQIFQGFLDVNPDSFTYDPILVVSRPEIKKIDEGEYAGGLTITYEIRPEAVWDNGDPITAADAIFSLKAVKNPRVDAEHLRGYLEFIDDIKVDPGNPKKLTIYCKDRYFMSEIWSSLTVIPEYIYDPEHIMRKFSLKELNDPANRDRLLADPDINRFANEFNSEKYQRQPGFVVGSGPYEYESWTTGQRIILKRKEHWWGDKLMGKANGFEAYPKKLIYEVITDPTTALSNMKDEGGDVLGAIPSKDFIELKDDKSFTQFYNLYAPIQLAYSYVAMNMKNPKLEDVKVRQALSHLVDRKQMIDVLLYGLAETVDGPIHPTKDYYDKDIKPYDYNIKKATELLEQAGWKDTDGDGIRDKVINGVKTPLELELKYVSGGTTAEKIGLMFKNSAEKAGVKLNLVSKEWTVFIDESKAHNFEMFLGGWIQAPVLDDPKQIWHTQSYDGGSNYVGFGNERTDELIEKIRYELDKPKRDEMYKEFQEIVHEQAPYIFLWSSKNKLIIHKRFDNADPKVKRPGYMVNAFKLNPHFGVRQQLAN